MGLKGNSNGVCSFKDNTKAFVNVDDWIKILNLLKTKRVDFVGMGDSNQIRGSVDGWDEGMQKALSEKYPMFATGFVAADAVPAQVGYKYKRVASVGGQIDVGAPSALSDTMDDGGSTSGIANYGFVADGASVGSGGFPRGSLQVDVDCPLDVKANLTFELYAGTFISGTAPNEYRPFLRSINFPYSFEVDLGVKDSITGSEAIIRHDLNLVADPTRDKGIICGYTESGVTGIEGPFFSAWTRAINTDRTNGFAYTTQYFQSGQGLRDIANLIQNSKNAYLDLLYSNMRRVQLLTQPTVNIVFTINSGLNDRVENLASVGTKNVQDPDSAAAYIDNAQAIIDRIVGFWNTKEWDLSEIHFIISVSQPISNPDDIELASYRQAVKHLARKNPQTIVIDLEQIMDSDELISKGYESGGDLIHLTLDGYTDYFRQILAVECG